MTRVYLLMFGVLLATVAPGLRAGAADPPAEESSLDQEIAELRRVIAAKRDEADALSAKLQALVKQRREELAAAKPRTIEPDERLTISSITPNEGAAGAMLRLRGKGFTGTKKVMFVVPRLPNKEAAFKVISDEELSVIAPEYLTPGTTPVILVHSDAGVTATVPRSATAIVDEPTLQASGRALILAVRKGGISTYGGLVALVEDGGVITSPGIISLVKSGGRMATSNSRDYVYYERGALLEGPKEERTSYVEVPLATFSPVDELFTFTAAQNAEGESKLFPKIASIAPNRGYTGQIVTIRGEGFLGTESVLFFPRSHGSDGRASFQIVSDTELRVEIPADYQRLSDTGNLIAVQTPKGLTVTMAKDIQKTDSPEETRDRRDVNWIVKGGILRRFNNGAVCLVDDGGIAIEATGIMFVRSGGTLLDDGGSGTMIFHEPKASLGDEVRRENKRVVEIPSIGVSLVDAYFNAPEKR